MLLSLGLHSSNIEPLNNTESDCVTITVQSNDGCIYTYYLTYEELECFNTAEVPEGTCTYTGGGCTCTSNNNCAEARACWYLCMSS